MSTTQTDRPAADRHTPPRAATAPPNPLPPAPSPNPPFRGDPGTEPRGNKAGGSKEGGPATPAGRAVSARNATTHGLFARDVVLPALGEDPAAFDALLTLLCRQLPPRNLLERHYLEQIAAASWRLRRLHRWQAQVYEDPALDEGQRLDRLDRTLRHEVTLSRQIDHAVRTLNRDLKWLFEGRARDEAFYQRDLTPAEVRAEPELEIEVQRDIWRRLRPMAAPDLSGLSLDNGIPPGDSDATLDNEVPPGSDAPRDNDAPLGSGGADVAQKCENEPAAPSVVWPPAAPNSCAGPPPPAYSGTATAPQKHGNCENEPPPLNPPVIPPGSAIIGWPGEKPPNGPGQPPMPLKHRRCEIEPTTDTPPGPPRVKPW